MKRFKRGGSSLPVVIKSGDVAVIPGDDPRMELGPPLVRAVVRSDRRTTLTPATAR
jgi:hypothetical protein